MPDPVRSRPPSFQPRFTLGIFYLFGLFFLYSMLLVLPEMIDVLETVPTGPAQEQAALEATRAAASERMPWAFVGSIATVLIGAKQGWLPGLRPRD
jgi:hypothetical protein